MVLGAGESRHAVIDVVDSQSLACHTCGGLKAGIAPDIAGHSSQLQKLYRQRWMLRGMQC